MSQFAKGVRGRGRGEISRVRPPRTDSGRAPVKIRHYDRQSAEPPKQPISPSDRKVAFLPQTQIPPEVFDQYKIVHKKLTSHRRVNKRVVKVGAPKTNEDFFDLKQEIMEMGSKLTEVEGKLSQRVMKRASRSSSQYNIHERPWPSYKPFDYSQDYVSALPTSTLPDFEIAQVPSSAEVGQVIDNIRAEIDNWKKKRIHFHGMFNVDKDMTIEIPTSDVRDEAGSDVQRNVPVSKIPSAEKLSDHSHYPLDKYLPCENHADVPQLNEISLKMSKSRHNELFGTLSNMTKELEKLKKPVLRRSVSDITTNSIGDSESCYTEELVETQFRKATYAFRKKSANDAPRRKSHFTMVNHESSKFQLNKENDRLPFQGEMGENYSHPCVPTSPENDFQNFNYFNSMNYQREFSSPRCEDFKRDIPSRLPLSPVRVMPNIDDFYDADYPDTSNSQIYPPWNSNSNSKPVPLKATKRPLSRNRQRKHFEDNPEKVSTSPEKIPEKLSPTISTSNQKQEEIPDLRSPSINMQAQLKPKPVQDVCVNTDFINSSVYNFKSKFDIVDKNEGKSSSKTFAVQKLPKLSIRPRLVTQVNPNVNIWPQRVTKCKSNVGYVEFIHPQVEAPQIVEDKSIQVQNFQPKVLKSAKTNKKRETLSEEKPGLVQKKGEPKLLRVAEQFCNTLDSKKHQEFVDLKASLQNLLVGVNDLFDNQLYTIDELQKVSSGSKHSPEDLPRRMNMVADLLEDEILKFGTQNMDHYEHLGRVMNILTDDIQSTLNAVESQQKISAQSSQEPSKGVNEGGRSTVYKSGASSRLQITPFIQAERGPLREDFETSSDYETQKTLELRLSRIEKLFEINKSLKDIIEESSEDRTESYSSTPRQETPFDRDSSEACEDKSYSDQTVEENLNETYTVDRDDKKKEKPDEQYMKHLREKADKILHKYKMGKHKSGRVDNTNKHPEIPQVVPILPSTSTGFQIPKSRREDLEKAIEVLSKQLKGNKRDVEVEVSFDALTQNNPEIVPAQVPNAAKETQTELSTASVSIQHDVQEDKEYCAEASEKLQETQMVAKFEPVLPELPFAIRPFNTEDLPPPTLSPAPPEMQIVKQPMETENCASCSNELPFLKFSNPNTKSFLEIRLPEQDKFKSSLVLQSNSKGGDIKLSYNRNDQVEAKKEIKEIGISPFVSEDSSETSTKLNESIQVISDKSNKPSTSKVFKKDKRSEDRSVGEVQPNLDVHLNNLSVNLFKLLETRINEMVSAQTEQRNSSKRSTKTNLEDLSLSDLENLQELEASRVTNNAESDVTTEPSPRLLPLPQTVLNQKVFKDADVQVSPPNDERLQPTSLDEFPRLKPYPGFAREAEDVQVIRKTIREEVFGQTISKVPSLNSILDLPKTISPRPEEQMVKPPPIHVKPSSSAESIIIPFWDSDEMSEGEIGYVFTSSTYSSGEIKPRPQKSGSKAVGTNLSDEDLLNCLKMMCNPETQVEALSQEWDKENPVGSDLESTPETTTSETPPTSDSGEN